MIIPINSTWRIATDKNGWIVCKNCGKRKNRETGETETNWIRMTYHSSLHAAAHALTDQSIRMIDADSIETITKEIEKMRKEITEALRPFQKMESIG
jgi:septal ring factor EnvC (AmiA/AmiB activator)